MKEQLLYEIGDPQRYITPDCIADFTTVRLTDVAPNRVRVEGVRGAPPTGLLKLSINYSAGWKAVGALAYTWPQALEKAREADRIVRRRLQGLGLEFEEICSEFLGVNACHGMAAPPSADPPEVQLRIGVRGNRREDVERFTRELAPLVLGGPPGATGYADSRPPVREVVAYWPALISAAEIKPRIQVVE